jgi:hypothetical protein
LATKQASAATVIPSYPDVVPGRVRDVHARQLADDRLVLEDRLQHALAHLGLVRRVGSQELAPGEDSVDHRRDVVVVDAGAQERQLLPGLDVPLGEIGQMGDDLLLREGRLEVELAPEADRLGDVGEQVLDARDADRGEHGVPVRVGEGEMAHCSAARAR